ncbi:PfkB family carbohydrate kinase [endosymbiont of Lamellibrachia barhami]|uniref:PfkB family carbohydrate kinase n=1 Tax=endosymbiont of Lamellibrachia barhami TaxID=205975 RepID=UPI0015B06B2B|nr:PfkB family carbohydrate kinase [endosymbiont of Lamellibrachia barhami]
MRILSVGIATLDIINTVAAYPSEDEELRALEHRVARGGNATNTLVVLSQFGHACSWAGTIADEPDSRYILDDLTRYGVDLSPVVHHASGKVPTSYVVLSRENASRTIVHYRDLPEYSAVDFSTVNPAEFDWIHFEGRNPTETLQMLQRVKEGFPQVGCSLEVEKPRAGIDALLALPDVLFFSKVFAESRGHADAASLLMAMRESNPQALLFCAWGDEGAWMLKADGGMRHQPAIQPAELVDTLGAGDVFNAGVIDGLLRENSDEKVLMQAVRLAGIKCGQVGFGMKKPGHYDPLF